MAETGLNYFAGLLGVSPDKIRIYYDFNTSGSIPSVSGGQNVYTGQVSSTSDFFNYSGSGYFTGQYVTISNTETGLYNNNFTHIFVYDKSGINDAVLFSSYNGESITSGYLIGITAANKPYFEYRNEYGPVSLTSTNIIPSKNIVAVSKISDTLYFYYFNPNTQKLESETFSVDSKYIIKSDSQYIGQAVNAPSFWSGNAFLGFLDEYVYMTGALAANTLKGLISGFYATKNADTYSTVTTVIYETGYTISGVPTFYTVTETSTGIIGYSTETVSLDGVTGFIRGIVGTFNDACGISRDLYTYSGITGYINYDTFVPITGTFSRSYTTTGSVLTRIETVTSGVYTVTGTVDNGYNTNTSFLDSLGMEGIAYLRAIDSKDVTQLFTITGQTNITNYNKESLYDMSIGKFVLDTKYTDSGVNIFVNGLYQLPSGMTSSGTIYSGVIHLSGDYGISGQSREIESTGYYDAQDSVFYDVITGLRLNIYFAGGTGSIENIGGVISLNGQVLCSGIDWIADSSNIYITGLANGYDSGNIFSMPVNVYTVFTTGTGSSLMVNNFARYASQLYMNGQRMVLNSDYVEVGDCDLLTGANSEQTNYTIYDNNGLYWDM